MEVEAIKAVGESCFPKTAEQVIHLVYSIPNRNCITRHVNGDLGMVGSG